jgi:hypothetical protein
MSIRLIQEAISIGAPAYNAGLSNASNGGIAKCAEIYAKTATQLLGSFRFELAPNVISKLEDTLQTIAQLQDKRGGIGSPVDEVAWSFRHAFDAHLASGVPAKNNRSWCDQVALAPESVPKPAITTAVQDIIEFPKKLGNFNLVPCDCTMTGCGLGAESLMAPHGGNWELSIEDFMQLGKEARRVLSEQPFGDMDSLHGQFSPLHELTLSEEQRAAASIPVTARWFAWSYPVVERLALTTEQRRIPDIAFLTVGGFIYLDSTSQPVATLALMPDPEGSLKFEGPFTWQSSWSQQVHPMRFAPVTLAPLRAAGAKRFAWLLPGENFDGENLCPHGGFAYRMEGDRPDIFFTIAGGTRNPKLSVAEPEKQSLSSKQAGSVDYSLGFPFSLGPFKTTPCTCLSVGTGQNASSLRAPHGGRWTLSGNDLPGVVARMTSVPLRGHFSPLRPVTLSPWQRRVLKIPKSAAFFAWSHPVEEDFGATKEQIASNPDVSFLCIGGFIYLDKDYVPVATTALVPHATGPMQFEGPFHWKSEWTAQIHPSRFTPVTLSAFQSAGARHFCWVMPEEEIDGYIPCPHGGFAYRMAGSETRDLFFVMRVKFPDEELASLATAIEFEKGDRVEIWSKSRKQWIDGSVDETYPNGGLHDGFWLEPGDVKVSWSDGWKFVSPCDFNSALKHKAAGGKKPVETVGPNCSGSCVSFRTLFKLN